MENLTLTYFVRSWERHSGIMGPGIGLWRREYRETCRVSELKEEARVVDIEGSWYRLEGHIHGVCSQKEKGEALSYVIFTLSPTLGNGIFLLRATTHALASLLQPHLFLLAIHVSVALSSPSLPRSTTSYRHLTAVCASSVYSTITIIDRYDPL